MSRERQELGGTGAIVVGAWDLDGAGFDLHRHETHQLAWASRGVLSMVVAGQTWVLPRSRALWIPATVPHEVATRPDTTMVSLYFEPEACPVAYIEPTVIDISGLLGQLIEHLLGELGHAERDRAERVVFDLLVPLDVATLRVPQPVDERARRVADALRSNPADGRTLAEWGREVGASGRTLARAIERETGMGFAEWRTHMRMAAALPMLGAGETVTSVAFAVGYRTPSAFVAAFKRTIGVPPGRYFDR